VKLAHVRDVEEAHSLADRRVLLEDRAVLHGELEAREGHQPPAELLMHLEKRCAPQAAHVPVR
jgi:hypothetical protein